MDDRFAVDDRVVSTYRAAAKPAFDEIIEYTCKGGTVEFPNSDVGDRAKRQLPDFTRTAKTRSPSTGCNIEHRTSRHRIGTVA